MGLEGDVAEIKSLVLILKGILMGNGQPGLEQRLVRTIGMRVDQVERHCKRNMEQGDADVLHLLDLEKQEREKQHAENQAKLGRIERTQNRQTIYIAGFGGALILLRLLVDHPELLRGLVNR